MNDFVPGYRLEAAMREAEKMNLYISYRNMEKILLAASHATDADNERLEALAKEAIWGDSHEF